MLGWLEWNILHINTTGRLAQNTCQSLLTYSTLALLSSSILTVSQCWAIYICYAQTTDSHHPRMVLREARIIALRSPSEDSHNASFVQCPSKDRFCVLAQSLTNGRPEQARMAVGSLAEPDRGSGSARLGSRRVLRWPYSRRSLPQDGVWP